MQRVFQVEFELTEAELGIIQSLCCHGQYYALRYVADKFPRLRRIDAILIVKSICSHRLVAQDADPLRSETRGSNPAGSAITRRYVGVANSN